MDTQEVQVYVIGTLIKNECVSPVKVGISGDMGSRLKSLKRSQPYELILVKSFRMPNRMVALDVEQCFHAVNRDVRLRGEWFDMQPDRAVASLSVLIYWSLQAFTDLNEEEIKFVAERIGLFDHGGGPQ